MTPPLDQPVAAADGRPGCPTGVWLDGMYRTRCGAGVDECHRHGPFDTRPPDAPTGETDMAQPELTHTVLPYPHGAYVRITPSPTARPWEGQIVATGGTDVGTPWVRLGTDPPGDVVVYLGPGVTVEAGLAPVHPALA